MRTEVYKGPNQPRGLGKTPLPCCGETPGRIFVKSLLRIAPSPYNGYRDSHLWRGNPPFGQPTQSQMGKNSGSVLSVVIRNSWSPLSNKGVQNLTWASSKPGPTIWFTSNCLNASCKIACSAKENRVLSPNAKSNTKEFRK